MVEYLAFHGGDLLPLATTVYYYMHYTPDPTMTTMTTMTDHVTTMPQHLGLSHSPHDLLWPQHDFSALWSQLGICSNRASGLAGSYTVSRRSVHAQPASCRASKPAITVHSSLVKSRTCISC